MSPSDRLKHELHDLAVHLYVQPLEGCAFEPRVLRFLTDVIDQACDQANAELKAEADVRAELGAYNASIGLPRQYWGL